MQNVQISGCLKYLPGEDSSGCYHKSVIWYSSLYLSWKTTWWCQEKDHGQDSGNHIEDRNPLSESLWPFLTSEFRVLVTGRGSPYVGDSKIDLIHSWGHRVTGVDRSGLTGFFSTKKNGPVRCPVGPPDRKPGPVYRDRTEVNRKRVLSVCDGWVCDLESTGYLLWTTGKVRATENTYKWVSVQWKTKN